MIKRCEYKECGREFKAVHSSNRFCCFEHGIENRRKPRLEGDCEYCHKHFISKRTATDWHYTKGGFKLRYCTRAHALAAQRKDKVKRICKSCGREFRVFPSVVKSGGGNTCSRKCYHKWNSGERHPNWNGGSTMKNDKLRKSPAYRDWRTSVFIRDNKTCVDCGKKYSKRTGLSAQIEADHIRPRYLFPELTLEQSNGRTLCIGCHVETPTYFNHKYERDDFMPNGRLYDYVLEALRQIGLEKDPLV